jgi:hypothetical protein
VVEKLSPNRLSASLAQRLYRETTQSQSERQKLMDLQKINNDMIKFQKGRPEKKQRRDLERFKRGDY